MDSPLYTKAALVNFIDAVTRHGSVNANTAAGWKAACARILEDLADDVDVRGLDVVTAVRRYHNKHPGELSSNTLGQYERRLDNVLKQFARYNENPTGYQHGRPLAKTTDEGRTPRKKVAAKKPVADAPAKPAAVQAIASALPGMSLQFPMRKDFTAQVFVPRDMSTTEARRFAHFIMTLAHDFAPPKETY